MPTYDYQCAACSHHFEQFQSMTARPLKQCPECGKRTLQRLIGAGAAVIFKGSGFHQTDYRSASYKAGAKNDARPEGGGCTPTCGTDQAPTGCKKPKTGGDKPA